MSDSINIVMPQIGEGISEATIVMWHKNVGDAVEEGETLLDITTAKIDVEIPAPRGGVVAEIRYPDGATVLVDTVIAVLAPRGTRVEAVPVAQPVASETPENAEDDATDLQEPEEKRQADELEKGEDERQKVDERPAAAPRRASSKGSAPSGTSASPASGDTETQRRNMLRKRSTPLVRKMARELGIDLAGVVGSGLHGRVTRADLDAYAERKRGLAQTRRPERMAAGSLPTPNGNSKSENFDSIPLSVAERRTEPMSTMRKMIAEHMERSYRRSPHAFTVFEFDYTKAERLRLRHREAFHRETGVKLTPLCFLLKAISDILPRFPIITAFLRDEEIVYPNEINIGVAVAIPNGLLVPVVHEVEGKSIEELAKGLHDVATRARQGKLILSDVEGGTFTVTSPGQQGCLMGIPIINQPQSAILHIGAITKQPAVVTNADGEDSIAIRHKAILTLGFDHRLIDGWEADGFMSALRERMEGGDFGLDHYV